MLDDKQLVERKEFLMGLISERSRNIMPDDGYLVRAIKHGKSYQYYLRKHNYDNNGKYVKRDELIKVSKRVQSEYDKLICKNAQKELECLDRYIESRRSLVENVYYKMPKGKQVLIEPLVESEQEFLDKWINYKYEKMGFNDEYGEYYSLNGLRVRSKSEAMIADLLDKIGIPFLYEIPLYLPSGMVRPDFTLIDVKKRRVVYLEHLGMMDDYTYRSNAVVKVQNYESAGFYLGETLIVTEESSKCPLNIKNLEKKLRHIFDI